MELGKRHDRAPDGASGEHRPWGYYEVLSSEETHKVKRIVVRPGKRTSLQRHRHRREHWHFLAGRALLVVDGSEIDAAPGSSADIGRGMVHRITNIGEDDVVFIEVQTGDYFGEDDIERLEDDFGRI
jgi:mannose-6-phosphate isomerase-like protein (cupin superfamily)